jgi:carbon monoxide dehydrogenase subunit G
MATIRKEIPLATTAALAWDAVRDFGNIHRRLVPGFVTACRLDAETGSGVARHVTFFNGLEAREHLVTRDDAGRRLAYGATGGRATHYNAVVEVTEQGGRTRIVWTIDLLPDALAGPIAGMMDRAAQAMQDALDAR